MTRVIASLVLLASGFTLVFATNTATGEPGTEPVGLITPQRITLPAPEDDGPSVKAEQSVEAPSSQGKSLPMKAETAVTDARSQECGDGSGAETRLGLMQRTSIHGHCAR